LDQHDAAEVGNNACQFVLEYRFDIRVACPGRPRSQQANRFLQCDAEFFCLDPILIGECMSRLLRKATIGCGAYLLLEFLEEFALNYVSTIRELKLDTTGFQNVEP